MTHAFYFSRQPPAGPRAAPRNAKRPRLASANRGRVPVVGTWRRYRRTATASTSMTSPSAKNRS